MARFLRWLGDLMTSRIPPSRRDPEYAPQRAAKVVQQQTPGAGRVAGVAQAGVPAPIAAALRGKGTPTPASGGGVLGYGEVTLTFPSAMASGSSVAPTGVSLGLTEGDHGLSVAGLNLTYQPGVYVIALTGQFKTSAGTTAETHLGYLFGPGMGFTTASTIGQLTGALRFHVSNRYGVAITGGFSAQFQTNAAVSRNFAFIFDSVDLTFIRFADPA